MAKRGETRPWRLTFKWENGVHGVETFTSRDRAETYAAMMQEYATHRHESVLTLAITNRNDKVA